MTNRRTMLRSTVATTALSLIPVSGRSVSAKSPRWAPPAPRLPTTPATKQLLWSLKHINSGAAELSISVLESHFTADFLSALPASELLAIFLTYFVPNGPMSVARIEGPVRDDFVQAILTTPGQDWRVVLGIDLADSDRINSLFFTPVFLPGEPQPEITSWSTLKPKLKRIAPLVSFQVVELVDGEIHPLYKHQPDQVLGIGSSFKLYVLGELARQIDAGTVSWDELLEIRDDLRSLPNGEMRLEPAGAAFPIRHYMEQMIAASDNTATDHLITRIGRESVEGAFAPFGNGEPERNIPLLLTREWFAIKLRLTKKEIAAFIDAGVEEKRSILSDRVAKEALTLTETEEWPGSYFIETIEWFASAADLCRVTALLHAMSQENALSPIRDALSKNPGLAFDARTWAYVGYKGGYETGVKSDVWLLQRGDGRLFIIAAIINDTNKEIDGIGLTQLMMPMAELLAELD